MIKINFLKQFGFIFIGLYFIPHIIWTSSLEDLQDNSKIYTVNNQKEYVAMLQNIKKNKIQFFLKANFEQITKFMKFLIRNYHMSGENETLINYMSDSNFQYKIKIFPNFLAGTQNRDPRVRIISLFLLKDLLLDIENKSNYKLLSFKNYLRYRIPKEKRLELTLKSTTDAYYKEQYEILVHNVLEQVAEHLSKSFYLETIENNKNYCVFNLKGYGEFKNSYLEVKYMLFYLVRYLSIKKLKEASLQASDFESLNPIVFQALIEKIYDEKDMDAPIFNLKERMEILFYALKHPMTKIREQAAFILAKAYYSGFLKQEHINIIDKLSEESSELKNFLNILKTREKSELKSENTTDLLKCSDEELSSKEMKKYKKVLNYLGRYPIFSNLIKKINTQEKEDSYKNIRIFISL